MIQKNVNQIHSSTLVSGGIDSFTGISFLIIFSDRNPRYSFSEVALYLLNQNVQLGVINIVNHFLKIVMIVPLRKKRSKNAISLRWRYLAWRGVSMSCGQVCKFLQNVSFHISFYLPRNNEERIINYIFLEGQEILENLHISCRAEGKMEVDFRC